MKTKIYDNVIMSWSCIGDFMLVSQSFNSLIKSGQLKNAVIISHEKSLLGLLEDGQNITLLYPTKNLKDFFKLFLLMFKKNIFILQDMPSYNFGSKQVRLLMAFFLTLRFSSKFVFMKDKKFSTDLTSKISSALTKYSYGFDTSKHIHISQNMLDILSDLNITKKLICDYSLKIKVKEYYIDNVNVKESVIIHPFASSPEKSMTKEWWLKLTNLILEKYPNKKIIIIGGKKDFTESEFIGSNRGNILNLAGKIDLLSSLYLVKNCEFIFCAESGPSNYAAFYRKNMIVIWFTKNTESYYMNFNPNADFIFNNEKSYSGISSYSEKSNFSTGTPQMCFKIFNKKMENR